MTIRKTFIATLLCLLTALSAGAQGREQIELVLIEGNTAIFSSEGFSGDKESAIDNSCQAVLRKLLYTGVEDFNGGDAIVSSGQNSNLWLKEFFSGKFPPYKSFIEGVELLGDFGTSPQGEVYCRTHVMVNFDQLLYQCRTQGLMEDASKRPAQPAQKQQRPKRSFL